MPITYEISKTEGLIRTRCAGNVKLEDVIDHFRTLEQDPDCPDRLDVLLDLREATVPPASDKLRSVVAEIGRIRRTVQFGACAILVGTDAFMGTAKVFEVFAARSFRTTHVSRDPDEAEAWLAAQRSGVN